MGRSLAVIGILVLLCVIVSRSNALIGYDCSHRNMNITSFSLVDVEPCSSIEQPILSQNKTIQLVQLAKNRLVHVYQCRVKVRRSVTKCSWFNDAQAVAYGDAEFLKDLTGPECLDIHKFRRFSYSSGLILDNLKWNGTSSRVVIFAGEVSYDGSCTGASYSDHWGSWTKVIVQGQVDIMLRDLEVPVDLMSNQLILPSGYRCQYSDGQCSDAEYGMSTWEKLRPALCEKQDYDVLFEGKARHILPATDKTGFMHSGVYSVEADDTIFALTAHKRTRLCRQDAIETEHPRLFIIEDTGSGFAKPRSDMNVYNTDLFTYVNSKFVYLEKHIHRQLSSMYADVLHQKCMLEQEVLKQRLTMATVSLSEFAFLQGGGPGFSAVRGGEVVYLVRCQPVAVALRPTPRCYLELPVTAGNTSKYMAPKTRILQSHGTEIDCSSILPSVYLLDNQWYSLSPEVRQAQQPQVLRPMGEMTWTYMAPGHLATSGIYSEQTIEKLSDHIMFPMELPAITSTLARSVVVNDIDRQNLMYQNLIDESIVSRIAQSTWNRLWGWFGLLGDVVSGLIGLYMVARCCKFLLDTLLHCLMIHETLGLTWKIALGLIDSGTSYVLNKHHTRKMRKDDPVAPTSPDCEAANDTQLEPFLHQHPPSMHESKQDNLYPHLGTATTSYMNIPKGTVL